MVLYSEREKRALGELIRYKYAHAVPLSAHERETIEDILDNLPQGAVDYEEVSKKITYSKEAQKNSAAALAVIDDIESYWKYKSFIESFASDINDPAEKKVKIDMLKSMRERIEQIIGELEAGA